MNEEDLKPQNIVATKKALTERFFVSIDAYIVIASVAFLVTLVAL